MKWIMVSPHSVVSKALKKLNSFSELERGWHYGSGLPISGEVLSYAREMLSLFESFGISNTNAFPGRDGEVLLTGHRGGIYIGLTIEASLLVTLVCEDGGEDARYVENCGKEQIKAELKSVAAEKWLTSDLSTPASSTMIKVDSATWHSRTRQTVECRYLSRPVPKGLVAA